MAAQTILDEIVRCKRIEVERSKRAVPREALRAAALQAPPPRDFASPLQRDDAADVCPVRLIAEVKRASPSKGELAPDLDAVFLAQQYESHGAAAISVLTDERFFQGSLADLQEVRRSVSLPVLRKDFVFDPYQVYEARAAGADAVLLIVAILNDDQLGALHQLVSELGMAALVEVHDEAELARAIAVGPGIVGVNNRDLNTFQVNLQTTARLRSLVPADVLLVAESGVHTRAEVAQLAAMGADAMLVGETLVCAKDVGGKIRELVG
jgi:indole-3-glycerol phosphate synthase